MKKQDKDELLDLLIDTKLSPEEIRKIEEKLKGLNISQLPSVQKIALIRKTLQEMGKDTPHLPHSDFIWQRVQASLQHKNGNSSSFIEKLKSNFTFPRWQWTATVLVLFIGLMVFWKKTQETQFGSISPIYSFSKEVTATAYNSTSGDATIVWLSGLSDIKDESNFGEIWQVYSYKKDVSVTSYESDQGNATIIWVDDIDTSSTRL